MRADNRRDLRSIENIADRLLLRVKEIIGSGSSLRGSSVDKLRHVSTVCGQVVNLLSDITGSDTFPLATEPCSDSSFNQFHELSAEVRRLSSDIGELSELILDRDKFSCIDMDKSMLITADSGDNVEPAFADKKKIIKQYDRVLAKASTLDYHSSVAGECANLLYRWFKSRISTKYDNAPPFTYSVTYFRDILYAIVLVYGYHVENGSVQKFMQEFDDWERSLYSSKESNKWVAPYEINQVRKCTDKKYGTLTAAVLYDLLIGHPDGICNLFQVSSNPKVNLRKYEIVERVWKLIEDEDEMNRYVHYSEDFSIVQSLGLTDKLNYPAKIKGKLSTVHADIVTYVVSEYKNTKAYKSRVIDLLNTISYFILTGDNLPANWSADAPFDNLPELDKSGFETILGNLYLKLASITWDIDEAETTDTPNGVSANYDTMPNMIYQYEPWYVYSGSGPRSVDYRFNLHRDIWTGNHLDGKCNELIRFCEANCYPEFEGAAVHTSNVTLYIAGKKHITGIVTAVKTDWDEESPIGHDGFYLHCILTLSITEIAEEPLNYNRALTKGLIGYY